VKARNLRIALVALATLLVGGAYWWSHVTPNYLPRDASAFVAQIPAPPARNSAQERAEIAELLAIQVGRTNAIRDVARADRKKDIRQFYGALGIDPSTDGTLKPLRDFMQRVEGDASIYVRAAKQRFARARPYVVEPRLEPCIDDVADNESYPSGHSTYAYVTALLLADMVPERRTQLLARADAFAHQRMVCGVHFASDIAAGHKAAEWLLGRFAASERFRAEKEEATRVLRAALVLPPAQPGADS
jgi:acid phosphatase (class A)